jgi:hypothetical protein
MSPSERKQADDQEQRVRAALGLEKGPLPKVAIQWLRKYHAHLAGKLSLPFRAQHNEETGLFGQAAYSEVEVVALVDPDKSATDEYHGLVCKVRKADREMEVPLVDLEVDEENPNFRLIEDYWYWIWNWRFDPRI